MPTEPKKVLCIHDLSGAGRCSLAVILPVLAVMGVQPVALPTMLLSTHTGGLGAPARLDCEAYGHAALAHYRELGLAFDCIYTGYLGIQTQGRTRRPGGTGQDRPRSRLAAGRTAKVPERGHCEKLPEDESSCRRRRPGGYQKI